ncbi:Calcium/proton exchanger [Marasmius fiardii PR-910]|nr:Calcium/proton exchanger [Marasmius fiardii PR-910]
MESGHQPLVGESNVHSNTALVDGHTTTTENGANTNDGSTSQIQQRRAEPGRRNTNQSNSRPSFSLQRVKTTLLVPARSVGPAPTILGSIKSIVLASWLNLFLVFIPVSWALNFAMPDNHTLIFVFSFLAIIPLAKLLAFATDELSMRVGQTLAGLINATLGNAVELIVAIIALTKCQLQIVQSSLVGSILSNLLLVLGMCFFAGGIKYSEQGFGAAATQLNSSLLTISVIAVLLPAAFHLNVNTNPNNPSDSDESEDILKMSHGVAILLLLIYLGYLIFQLYSHTMLYTSESVSFKSTRYKPRHKKKTDVEAEAATTSPTATLAAAGGGDEMFLDKPEEEEEEPSMSLYMAIGLLVVVTVFVAVTAEWLVDSIDGLVEGGVISKEFVGVILLPIVGNAAEHVTAVTVSVKDKLTLSLGVAVGSSIQIALFVIPFIVTLAWILGKPLTLLFDPYESITLFLAVIVVNYCVQDGKSNWLEGFILMFLYLIIGVTFWFYPGLSLGDRGLNLQCS